MDSAPTPSGSFRDLSTWSFDEAWAWAQVPDRDGQELEHVRTVAVHHAQDDRRIPEDRRRWAKLALQVNARIPGDGPAERARRTANNTRLRTFIIDRLGPDHEDPDWCPEQVVQDVLDAIPLIPAQAEELSNGWQEHPIDQIRELRRIKNITAPLQELIAHLRPGPLHDQAQSWLDVRARLP